MKKAKACFADGGQISKADQMIAEMERKYGVSGNSQPAPHPVAQPAPQPAPQQSSKGLIGDALNLFGNRQKQIDKASGYANGGLIKGIGTPTSDSIDAQVNETGEPIKVSTKERIVSHEQDKLLQRLAKAMGFDSVDAFFEAGTGKPVGPTIKGGKMAHSEGGKPAGWRLDNDPDAYAKAMQDTRNAMSIPSLSTNNSAANGGIYKDVGLPSISMGAGQAPTIYENGGLPTKTDRVSGSLPVATVSKPAGDGARPWYMQDPLTAISSGIEKSMNASQAAEDYNKSLYPAGTFDSATKPTVQQSTTGNPLSSVSPTYPQSRPGASDVGLAGIVTKPSAASVSDNQFTQGGKNYTVNQTSQDGIKRVTGGTSPLYTNIDPAQGVAGLKNQMIGGDAASVNEGLSRYANANKITGEMIANRDKDIPAGGYAPGILGDGGVEAANAEKTQRWRQDDLLRLATRGNQAAIGAIVNADSHRDVATMGNETQRQNAGLAAQVAGNRDNVTMRGQDLQAQSEAARIAGNPVDSQMKQLSLGQAQKMQQLYDKAAGGDASALKELQLRNPKEPNYSNRYITVPGGEETGPDGMTKIRRPSRVFDAQTGQWINEGGQVAQQQSAPASAIEYLKKNPNQAEAFKAKYGYIPAGL